MVRKIAGLAACRFSGEEEFTDIFNGTFEPVGCGGIHQGGCAQVHGINNRDFDPT